MSSSAAAVLLAGLAGLLGVAARRDGLARLATTVPAAEETGGGATQPGHVVPSFLPRLLAGLAAVAALSSHGGAAAVLAVLTLWTGLPMAGERRRSERLQARVAADLPRAADLLAGCLEAGATTAAALGSVAAAIGGPVGLRLGRVAGVLSAGGEVAVPAAGSGDPVDRLVGAVARAAVTGAPLAASVRDLADDERERERWAATERARVAGVRAVGPLALCFLPAFVMAGVVPVVAGVARSLLTTAS